MNLFIIFFSAALINNYVLAQFLGMCPFLGVSKKLETAAGMGAAVTFVMTLASVITYLVYNFILLPLGIIYLHTVVFILVIASIVQFVELFIRKNSPPLYHALGVYLPLITTNCAVFGVTLINVQQEYNFFSATINSFGAGIGFLLAIILMAGIREKYENNPNVPDLFKGFPLTLFSAGFMSIAFLGFQGLV